MATAGGTESCLTFDSNTQAWLQQLYEAWANNAPLSTYSAIRDGLLGQREHLDMRIATLSAVAKIACSRRPPSHQLDALASSGWDELLSIASIIKSRTSSDSSDNSRKRKRAYNEANRLRNLALVAALWSPQLVFHYGWNSASQVQMNMLRACAAAYPSFLHDFRPRLNAVLLERHRQGIRSCRVKTLNEAPVQLHRDLDLGVLNAVTHDEAAENRWVTSQDGCVSVNDATGLLLKDVRPKHFQMYLLRRDRYGLLAARGENSAPSSPQMMPMHPFTPISGPLCYPPRDPNSRSPISEMNLQLQPPPLIESDTIEQQRTRHIDCEPQHGTGMQSTLADLSFNHLLAASAGAGPGDLASIPDAEFLALLDETQLSPGLRGIHATDSYDTSDFRSAAHTTAANPFVWPAALGDLHDSSCNADAFIDPSLGPGPQITSAGQLVSNLTSTNNTSEADLEVLSLADQPVATGSRDAQHHQVSPGDDLLISTSLSSSTGQKSARLYIHAGPRSLSLASPLVVGSPSTSIERTLHTRYRNLIATYMQQHTRNTSQAQVQASKVFSRPSPHHFGLSCSACLSPSTQWALAWTHPDSPLPMRGRARSPDEADLLYLTGDQALLAAQQQQDCGSLDLFLHKKPIVIKERFLDSNMHTVHKVARLLQHSSASSVLEVDGCSFPSKESGSTPDRDLANDILSKLLRSEDSNTLPEDFGSDATTRMLRLRNITNAHRPRVTMLPRFRLLDNLIERTRRRSRSSHGDGSHSFVSSSSLQTLIDSASFSTLGLTGSSAARCLSPLISGTWFRNLDGILFCTLTFPRSANANSEASDRQSGDSGGETRFFILEQDDVLLIPPGYQAVCALHSATHSVAEGGLFWDSHNVIQIVKLACDEVRTEQSSTKTQSATQSLMHDEEEGILDEIPRLVTELEALVKSYLGDFSGSMEKDVFLSEFQAAINKFRELCLEAHE
ncbi:hypothetical protein BD289DRAFT_482761 [Coniella lustricola]|uniref:JmjC domain-containing protein n=1 Tax=Coniella lustricola TaxID=2025994 RepID=A0A2T3A7U3_9PEZI|nr:hypothetical protein BD289DRAFT_482761 [Coniella lustricola]